MTGRAVGRNCKEIVKAGVCFTRTAMIPSDPRLKLSGARNPILELVVASTIVSGSIHVPSPRVVCTQWIQSCWLDIPISVEHPKAQQLPLLRPEITARVADSPTNTFNVAPNWTQIDGSPFPCWGDITECVLDADSGAFDFGTSFFVPLSF